MPDSVLEDMEQTLFGVLVIVTVSSLSPPYIGGNGSPETLSDMLKVTQLRQEAYLAFKPR